MKIKIRRGYDIPLAGAVGANSAVTAVTSPTVAIIPDDFHGFIPKIDVRPGDVVDAGSPIAHHKTDPEVRLTSPVAGRIAEVVRGERRHVERIVIERDNSDRTVTCSFDRNDPADCARALANSGLLAMMRQRPYDIVPDSHTRYRDIYVSAFDSAPLAAEASLAVADHSLLAAGVKMLKALTDGSVYIARRPGTTADVDGAVMIDVEGPHPASLASTHINKTAPLNKGERVLTLDIATLANAGRLFLNGRTDYTATVAVTGPALREGYLVRCTIGTAIDALVAGIDGHLTDEDRQRPLRIISGNVLTGTAVGTDSYLHSPYRQVTVMAEGSDVDQFMGWATLSASQLSVNPSFPGSWLGRLFRPDARVMGGRRAIIQSGEYERMIPLDIMAEYLIKAINARDIDNMEQLGIYEVAPEDFALAEFADSSKLPLQNIVRHGLDYLRGELEA